MISAPLPENEAARLAALDSYRVLDTDAEREFDDLTAIAAEICGTPIALVCLVDAHRQWFKSHHGLNACETPREQAFCAHAILGSGEFVVPDAKLDPRFHDNPLTTQAPNVVFYAGTPLVDPQGHALGTLCVIDHVPRLLTETQMHTLARLGRQVMCQMELRKSRDEARAAATAKSEFLATMSHEIRTPLNGVLGVTQLLSETVLSTEQQELVSVAQRSGEHLLAVVNDILDYSRLEAGRIQLEAARFNLHEVLSDVIAMTGETARRKNIRVHLQWHSSATSSRIGDSHRIRQILLNLISNAIKFTSQGSVTVLVADAEAAPGIQISVIDTGVGIAADVLPRLFSRFTQADSSTTRRFGGTGLGLAIVKYLIELMGGQVGVASQPGQGSRFWCVLPLPLASHEVSTPAHRPVGNSKYFDLQGRAVLVAEDDATNLLLLTRQLQRNNCKVTVAGNGQIALELCRHQPFDLILMDGMMPEMDGYEASRHIRELPMAWVRQVPIIAMTANALEGDREECLLAGMSDYLTKPFSIQAFNAALERAFGKPTVVANTASIDRAG